MRLNVDQRVFYRLPTVLPIQYRVVIAGAETTRHQGTTHNLSAGGMLLVTAPLPEPLVERLFDESAQVVVELPLEGAGRTIVSKTRLVWVEGGRGDAQGRLGLRFVSLLREEQQCIHDWIVARMNPARALAPRN